MLFVYLEWNKCEDNTLKCVDNLPSCNRTLHSSHLKQKTLAKCDKILRVGGKLNGILMGWVWDLILVRSRAVGNYSRDCY